MNFTFGIITSGTVGKLVIDSIKKQNMKNFEIIIVGGSLPALQDESSYYDGVRHIKFNESLGKYTIKKNIITENSNFDNIVYMHDYYMLDDNWYDGFLNFGDDWDICMNVIENIDGTRFRDWCAWDDPDICFLDGGYHRIMLPSYSYNKTKYMYISGGYWISKKYVMKAEPLDESLGWGESEDVEWSKRVLPRYNYKMNIHSKVKLLKDKKLSAEYRDD